MQEINLQVDLNNWKLDNPIIPASGTFGFGYEFANWYDINILGSLCLKTTTREKRFGNPLPRIAECKSAMLNAIGLENPGIDFVIKHEINNLKKVFKKKFIASVAGFSLEEYIHVASLFDNLDEIEILEINLSCPNVKNGGIAFGESCDSVSLICRELKKNIKKKIYIKLSASAGNIINLAQAAENSGADGLVLINSLLGMVINARDGKPIVASKTGGLSGKAIKPVALAIIYKIYKLIKIPIIGVGGISCADDVIEFLSAGASAVEIGSENLINPCACRDIILELPERLRLYNINSLSQIIGRSHIY